VTTYKAKGVKWVVVGDWNYGAFGPGFQSPTTTSSSSLIVVHPAYQLAWSMLRLVGPGALECPGRTYLDDYHQRNEGSLQQALIPPELVFWLTSCRINSASVSETEHSESLSMNPVTKRRRILVFLPDLRIEMRRVEIRSGTVWVRTFVPST
jgi:hypothetical protein